MAVAATQESDTAVPLIFALSAIGASGTPAGSAGDDGAVGLDNPTAFIAVTAKV